MLNFNPPQSQRSAKAVTLPAPQARTIYGAPISQFRCAAPHILHGKALAEVKAVGRSIASYGLLSPLVVTRQKGRLVVIDGGKRLSALRRMRFRGGLPRGLHSVPYVIASEAGEIPSLLSVAERLSYIRDLHKSGAKLADISDALHCSRSDIHGLLSVCRLSPPLKQSAMNGTLSLAQIKAYAVLADHDTQTEILLTLGPSAQPRHILAAIASRAKPSAQIMRLPTPTSRDKTPKTWSQAA